MTTTSVKTFADFDIDAPIHEALAELGIVTPFPIQELTLPLALSGADLIGQARTGTGKTLAFGIPILERIDTGSNDTQALVIVPTRELCLQVHDDLKAAGTKKGVSVVAAYGGRAIDPQSEAIAGGAEVVVGTPGRLLDLMRRGKLNLRTVTTLVLDEADEMLDMGFLPDVEQLIEGCADARQTLLFSATMPSEVVALARRYMRKPTFMRADVEESRVAPETRQHFFAVHRMDKPALVARILATPERGRCVVFTRTKRMADMLVKDLREEDLNAAAIHSDLRQEAREKTLARFRAGKIDVMCATEVAARGLDIDEVTHVINYDCPDDEKMYLHRIGRTGRAGADGVAVTLAIWSELARLDMIKKALDITEPTLEVFSTSSELDTLFPLSAPGDASGNGQKKATSTATSGKESGGSSTSAKESGGKSRSAKESGDTATSGGRRRGRSSAGSRTDGGADGGAATDSRTARDDRDDADDASTGGRRRVRRRSRGESGDGASGESSAAGSTAARDTGGGTAGPTSTSTGKDDATVVRRRVRQRSTSTAEPRGARREAARGDDTAKAAEPATPAAPAAAAAPDAEGEAGKTTAQRARRADRSTDSDGGRDDGSTAGDDRSAEHRGRQSGRRSGGSRRRGGQQRKGGGGSGRPRGRENGDSGAAARRTDGDRRTDAPSRDEPDAETARGDGQPALRRPFVVNHLP